MLHCDDSYKQSHTFTYFEKQNEIPSKLQMKKLQWKIFIWIFFKVQIHKEQQKSPPGEKHQIGEKNKKKKYYSLKWKPNLHIKGKTVLFKHKETKNQTKSKQQKCRFSKRVQLLLQYCLVSDAGWKEKKIQIIKIHLNRLDRTLARSIQVEYYDDADDDENWVTQFY